MYFFENPAPSRARNCTTVSEMSMSYLIITLYRPKGKDEVFLS